MRMRITGTTALIMNNGIMADPQHPIVQQRAQITAKKKNMTDADMAESARLSWLGCLYYDQAIGVHLPSANVFRAMIDAAARTRDGNAVRGGVIFLTDRAPIMDPKIGVDLERLWGGGTSAHVDRRIVTQQRARIPRVRPIFPNWSATYEVELDAEQINPDDFVMFAERAGRLIGVGDYRPQKNGPYGRFAVEVMA